MTRLKSYLFFLFLTTILYIPSASFAKVETITHTVRQPFGGSQSPDDARVAAVAKAKREALEQAGTYLESLTVVKDHVVEKDEILALAAGVLKVEIVSQKNYATEDAFGIVVVSKVDVDTSVLEERVRKLLEDRPLLEKYRKSQQREKELLAKVERLKEENRRLQAQSAERQEQKKKELKEQFHKAAQALTAVEWNQKALALVEDVTYTDPEKAAEYLDQAIKLDPTYPDTYNNRGIAYHQLGRYQRAIEDYDHAIRLDPTYPGTHHNRAITLKDLGQYQLAIQGFDHAIRLNPENPLPYIGRGNTYGELRQYRLAIEDFTRAIKLDSEIAIAYKNRGTAYQSMGEYERAIEDYDQAISLHPGYAGAYHKRGFAYLRLHDLARACRDWRSACELGNCDALTLAMEKGECR